MTQALPLLAQLYLLEDHARTLFPLTTKVLGSAPGQTMIASSGPLAP